MGEGGKAALRQHTARGGCQEHERSGTSQSLLTLHPRVTVYTRRKAQWLFVLASAERMRNVGRAAIRSKGGSGSLPSGINDGAQFLRILCG